MENGGGTAVDGVYLQGPVSKRLYQGFTDQGWLCISIIIACERASLDALLDNSVFTACVVTDALDLHASRGIVCILCF